VGYFTKLIPRKQEKWNFYRIIPTVPERGDILKKLSVFCIGILILFVVGCGGSKSTYSAESPEGVVQAYYKALKDGKPDEAYQYRKFEPSKTKEQFVSEREGAGMTFKDFTVGKGTLTGTTAMVPVTFKTGNSSMPEFTMNIQLVKEQNWLISGTGMGGQAGTAHGSSETQTMPPASGGNPHGEGGSVPLNK